MTYNAAVVLMFLAFAWLSPGQTPTLDLTVHPSPMTSIGVPGRPWGGTPAGDQEPILPLAVKLTTQSLALDSTNKLIVILHIENIGATDVYIPMSSDQASVHGAGMRTRYTAFIDIHQPPASAGHIMNALVDALYGSQSSPGSLFRLGPGKEVFLKIKGTNPDNAIKIGSEVQVDLSMSLLEDDRFDEHSRSKTIVSANRAVVVSAPPI